MNARLLFWRELWHRRGNALLLLCAVMLGVASLLSARIVLAASDRETEQVLARKQEELKDKLAYLKNGMRVAMLKLKFNLVILPAGQDVREWYDKGSADVTMPENYVEKLADSGILIMRHFLPILQAQIRWPEKKRRIILVGSRGEVPNLHKNPRKPMVQPVPKDGIVLGYELHHSLGLKPGDKVTLMGRVFTVARCHEERGSREDITAWIPLKDAQELLGKPGRINAILALECLCIGQVNLATLRRKIVSVLPGVRVLEQGSKVLARAEARLRLGQEAKKALEKEAAARRALRRRRERTAAILVPAILLACGVWMALLTLLNVRLRLYEIAVLRSFGCGAPRILALILVRPVLVALPGALLGIGLGLLAGNLLARWLTTASPGAGMAWLGVPVAYGVLLAAGAALVAAAAAWLPAVMAIRSDPAEVLRGNA